MTALPAQTTNPQGQQPVAPQTQPPQPAPVNQSAGQGLPPTGLQQQMQALNNLYSQAQNVGAQVGYGGGNVTLDTRQFQFDATKGQDVSLEQHAQLGSTSLEGIARNLAERYGLPVGRGRIVDEQGNFLYTPEQLADASGGSVTMGEAAAQMNYISQALANYRNEQQQKKGIAAMQTGMGQVQSRGRGSMAAMQSGFYQGIADLYANQEYEAADFSYYIQKEQQEIAMELQRRAEKQARKNAQSGFWTGIGTTIVGLFSGNVALIGAGAAQVGASAGQTGYF